MIKATPVIRYYAFVCALGCMVIAIPTSNYLMSLSQFFLAAVWLWDGFYTGIIQKFKIFFRNKVALILTSLFLLHLLGLIYTSDFQYACKDLRTKLPLIILPIMLCSMPLIRKKEFNFILLLYVATIFFGSMVSISYLFKYNFIDARELSPFISHIRFSLNVCLAIFILFYFIYKKEFYGKYSIILLPALTIWLTLYLFILKSLSGIIIFLIIDIIILIWFLFKNNNILFKITILIIIFLIPISFILYTYSIVHNYIKATPVNFSKLDKYTALGNPYTHDTINFGVENGRYAGIYISENELRTAWNKRSKLDFDGKDMKHQDLKFTLIRYLNSRNLRKDTHGLVSLSSQEIRYIEEGVANKDYIGKIGIKNRILQAYLGLNNYSITNDPNSSSFAQRIEYWKASSKLIKKNFWIGVGTGDMNVAFNQEYKDMKSQLDSRYQRRSHNQYLSIFVAFGLIGFSWFLITMILPGIIYPKQNAFLYFVFTSIILLSMLAEDTIESQAGVTFYAFFTAFLLFCKKEE